LRDSGYRVGCVGKLDLAKPDNWCGTEGKEPRTYRWGFTDPIEIEGKILAGRVPEPHGPYGFDLAKNGFWEAFHEDYELRASRGWITGVSHDSVLPEEAFADVYIGRRAVEWLGSAPQTDPWHLFVSFVGPHDPFDPPKTFAERTRHRSPPDPVPRCPDMKPKWVEKKEVAVDPQEMRHIRRQYIAATEAIDAQVGEILKALEDTGAAENTVILFAGDHGEMLGDHGLFKKNLPYEASLRIPMIFSGPGIKQGRETNALAVLSDLAPTICEMAGARPLPHIHAQSLVPILNGDTAAVRDSVFAALKQFRCIRTHTHKYIESLTTVLSSTISTLTRMKQKT
jgi:choline-sulfatase